MSFLSLSLLLSQGEDPVSRDLPTGPCDCYRGHQGALWTPKDRLTTFPGSVTLCPAGI